MSSDYAGALRRKASSSEGGKIESRQARIPHPDRIQSVAGTGTANGANQPAADSSAKRERTSPPEQRTGNAGRPSKKSKKPKPTLKNISLGDMMGHDFRIPKGQRPRPLLALSSDAPAMEHSGSSSAPHPSFETGDFPALVASTPQPKSREGKSGVSVWRPSKQSGTKQADKRVKTSGPVSAKTMKKKKPSKFSARKDVPQVKVRKEDTGEPRKSILDAFVAKQRDGGGREHTLLQLMQEGKITPQKGRQRVTPRTKKFTTLKKKVLQERLERYKEAHPEENEPSPAGTQAGGMQTGSVKLRGSPSSCTVRLLGFVQPGDLDDEEELEEIMSDLNQMASKIGTPRDIFIPPRHESWDSYPLFVLFSSPAEAAAAQTCWDGLVIGGQSLGATTLASDRVNESIADSSTDCWRLSLLEYDALDENPVGSVHLMLTNVLSEDDLADDDCLQETLCDLRSILAKYGSVAELVAHRHEGRVVATFLDGEVARRAEVDMNGVELGGNLVGASLIGAEASVASREATDVGPDCFTVSLQNVITEEDFEDMDSLKESLDDVRVLAAKFAPVVEVKHVRESNAVFVSFVGPLSAASSVVDRLNNEFLGGQHIMASIVGQNDSGSQGAPTSWIHVRNLVTEDDLEDPDCFEETKNDIRELAGQYGVVLSLSLEGNTDDRSVKIQYEGGAEVAQRAAEKFSQMVIGGQAILAAALVSVDTNQCTTADVIPLVSQATDDSGQKTLYSGDKLISERFAECKRVPKITYERGSRHYARIIDDGVVKPLLIEMLAELMRLQKRAAQDKNAKSRRRLVMGLREVARGIRSNKMRLVVMANNLDDYGVIDDKLQEILDLAKAQGIPVLFELNKRHLGKAVGKNMKLGVIGVLNVEGAHQQFKKLAALAHAHEM